MRAWSAAAARGAIEYGGGAGMGTIGLGLTRHLEATYLQCGCMLRTYAATVHEEDDEPDEKGDEENDEPDASRASMDLEEMKA